MKSEWTKHCSCPKEYLGSFRYFKSNEAAEGYWLAMVRIGEIYFASHGPGGHLLTVHLPGLCSCNDCSPTDNG